MTQTADTGGKARPALRKALTRNIKTTSCQAGRAALSSEAKTADTAFVLFSTAADQTTFQRRVCQFLEPDM